MDKKSVIKQLEKVRENLLEYGVSTEQLKAINYAIKTFKALSDLELLRIETEHIALAFGEDSEMIYNKSLNMLRHINREDIIKSAFRNKIEQAIKEIENISTYDGIYIDRAYVLEIMDKLIESEGK